MLNKEQYSVLKEYYKELKYYNNLRKKERKYGASYYSTLKKIKYLLRYEVIDMTEKYSLTFDENNCPFFHNKEYPLSASEVVDLLNSLSEKNEQLENEHERQNNEIKLLRKKIIELREDLEKIPPSIREVWLE